MNYKLNFKGINRRTNNRELKSFSDLETMITELFPQSKNHSELEFFYIDSDDDEVTMITDEDVQIMQEDTSDDKKIVKINVKTKIDILANKNAVKNHTKQNFIVNVNTGEKEKFDSSVEASRSKSKRGMTSKERRMKNFQKNIIKKRAQKKKEAIKIKFSKKVAKLEAIKEEKIMQLKTEELQKIIKINEKGEQFLQQELELCKEKRRLLKLQNKLNGNKLQSKHRQIKNKLKKQKQGLKQLKKLNKRGEVESRNLIQLKPILKNNFIQENNNQGADFNMVNLQDLRSVSPVKQVKFDPQGL